MIQQAREMDFMNLIIPVIRFYTIYNFVLY